MLEGKHIIVGISGGIAAYKIPELIRLLKKAGAEVRVVTSRNALEFVTELTLRTLSGYPVYSDVFAAVNQHSTEHISLPDWADMMIVAPASADVIGKMASGIADDALTTTLAAMPKPVIVAPAMNDKMYANPATQEAIAKLKTWKHITMLDCAEGELACGTTGKGRMQEVNVLYETIEEVMSPKLLTGRHIMLTVGPTQEAIDPVRYITNRSTGKMGYAIAKACYRMGAEVTIVAGPTSEQIGITHERLHVVKVITAEEMWQAAQTAFAKADVGILSAAVADYRPIHQATEKIKKTPGQEGMTLEMCTNPDIAATLGQMKRPDQRLIGFALETENEETNAMGKMERKNLDMIILNSLKDAGAGFGYDTNKVTLFHRSGDKKNLPLLKKEEIGILIAQELAAMV